MFTAQTSNNSQNFKDAISTNFTNSDNQGVKGISVQSEGAS